MDVKKEPLTMMVNMRQGFKERKLFDNVCQNCGYKNHLNKDCYRVIGYPADFKSKRKQGQGDTHGSNIGYIGCGDSERFGINCSQINSILQGRLMTVATPLYYSRWRLAIAIFGA
ncbi:hypothetical protein H5410_062106 [Solanum commersonii]|uniref:CCHC-type domain-containing protein n=1 Tax=Solanum commersonii TaxID=4109 RepID=A0A9J5WAN2_SOLCO|nr:hypothetical protein H5410_062106 [Solanum commersonii]